MENNTSNGYLMFPRSFLGSAIWQKPPLYLKVYLYLLSRAQHKEYKQLKRGQLFTSIPEIMENNGWWVGNRKEHPTKDQIFNILQWLRNPSETPPGATPKATMITTAKATHGILVTINDYNTLQDSKNYESNGESNGETIPKATRKQRHANNINKECKEDKNDKNIDTIEFDVFWNDYGKRVNRKECLKLYYKIPAEERIKISAHVKDYVLSTPDLKYRLDPLKYLRQDRWNDAIIQHGSINGKSTPNKQISQSESYDKPL